MASFQKFESLKSFLSSSKQELNDFFDVKRRIISIIKKFNDSCDEEGVFKDQS